MTGVPRTMLRGFPAFAGIDPQLSPREIYDARLPRVRGDRPLSKLLPSAVAPASPRSRG